jgi:hypothetical protein
MDKTNTVIVTISGGVAEVYHTPDEITVIVVDYDNLEDGEGYCPVCDEQLDDSVCPSCGFDVDCLDSFLNKGIEDE